MVLLVITLPLAVHFRIPSLWFLAPFALLTVTRRCYDEYGLTFREPGSLRFHVRVCLVIFGSYCVAHYGYARWWLGRSFHPALPPGFPTLVVDQLLVVGLSEEFFFRGYLQTQLNGWLGRPYRFLGAKWGWGLIAASVLFGICHLVEGDLTRLRVIFFGLLAGWLRERTRTIAVPAAYHGFANLLYDFMQRSMRSVT